MVPVTVTDVPPNAGPLVGLIELTVGAGGINVNWSALEVALVPFAVVTVMSFTPEPAGVVIKIVVGLFTV